MTGFEQTMVTVRYFLNHCCFDHDGTVYCRLDRDQTAA
jgi:hypothetical protein